MLDCVGMCIFPGSGCRLQYFDQRGNDALAVRLYISTWALFQLHTVLHGSTSTAVFIGLLHICLLCPRSRCIFLLWGYQQSLNDIVVKHCIERFLNCDISMLVSTHHIHVLLTDWWTNRTISETQDKAKKLLNRYRSSWPHVHLHVFFFFFLLHRTTPSQCISSRAGEISVWRMVSWN